MRLIWTMSALPGIEIALKYLLPKVDPLMPDPHCSLSYENVSAQIS